MIKRLLMLAMAATLATANSTAKDKPTVTITPIANDADAANDGIIYALPKTMLRVRVEAEVTIRKTGPYYKYSNKYLNLSKVVTEDSKAWKIIGASIETFSVADKNRRFKISGSQMPSLSLTPNGILTGINCGTTYDDNGTVMDNETSDMTTELTFDNVRLDKSVLTKTSTAAMAEEAALSIYRIREKRMSLLGGEEATILHDSGSYARVLEELDKAEAELMTLFAGKTEKIRVVRCFEIEPGASNMNSKVLFRFSEEDGFMDAMDITGKPVYIDIDLSHTPDVNTYADGSKQRKQNPVTGLRYIMPGIVNVKIIDRNKLLTEANLPCTQNGQIATLPVNLISDGYSIRLDSKTGALKEVAAPVKPVNDKKK